MIEVAPGLRYWSAPHPRWNTAADWPEDVGCVLYEAADALVLIDPLLPRGGEEAFLAALGLGVARAARPVEVLLTAPWHARDAAALAERYGTIVWAHPAAHARLPFEAKSGRLPEGIEVFVIGGVTEGEVAFYLRRPRALVVAEFLVGRDGNLRVCPSPALDDRDALAASLRALRDWRIDHVLVGHGPPVLGDGDRRIEEAVRAFS